MQRIETAGRVLVEDAHGAAPTLPFWFGEAPQRTSILCDGVSELREEISHRTALMRPHAMRAEAPDIASCIAWLMEECGVCEAAAL